MDRIARPELTHSVYNDAIRRRFRRTTLNVALALLEKSEGGWVEAPASKINLWTGYGTGAIHRSIHEIEETLCLRRVGGTRSHVFRWDFGKLLEGMPEAAQLIAPQTGNDGAKGATVHRLHPPPTKLSARAGQNAHLSQNPRFDPADDEAASSTDRDGGKLDEVAAQACIAFRRGRDFAVTGEIGVSYPASRARSREKFPGGFSKRWIAEKVARELVLECFNRTSAEMARRSDDFDASDYLDEVGEWCGGEFVRLEKLENGKAASEVFFDVDWVVTCGNRQRIERIRVAFMDRHKKRTEVAASVVRPDVADTTPPPDSREMATAAAELAASIGRGAPARRAS